jgi:glycosyltransferase involved in cell wall biosynthesis
VLPLVTIVTSSFNQADYLEDTIRSVLAQDYTHIEYMIIDGGSSDGSIEIIQKYKDRLAWWISEPDRGQAEAINKGMRRAKGEIVAWLNSDDIYLPGAISSVVSAFQADPALGMVFGDAITMDPGGHPLNKLVFGDWGLPELMHFRIICQPAVFIRRSVLEKAGYLDQSFHFMLDHHLWLRIGNISKLKHVSAFWAAARHHPTAKNVGQAAAFAEETYRVLDWMESNPEFAAELAKDARRIRGGANRLAARYYLDGGKPGKALANYLKALFHWPGYALKHWHRMVFSVLVLIGLGSLESRLRKMSSPEASLHVDDPRLENWPGLNLKREK